MLKKKNRILILALIVSLLIGCVVGVPIASRFRG